MWLVTCKSYRLQGAQGQRCDWRWFSVLYWPLMVRQNTDWRTEPSHPDKRQLSHRGSHALPQTCSLQCYSFELTLILLVRKRWSVYLLHKHVDNFQMCAFQWELLLFSFAFLEKLSGNVKRKKQQHFVVNRRVSQECKKSFCPYPPNHVIPAGLKWSIVKLHKVKIATWSYLQTVGFTSAKDDL